MTTTYRADGHPVLRAPSAAYLAKLHWRLSKLGRLPMWVVYNTTTREYPGVWVARMHVSLPEPKPTRFVLVHDSLAELRDALPRGLAQIGRHPIDPAEIVETWF